MREKRHFISFHHTLIPSIMSGEKVQTRRPVKYFTGPDMVPRDIYEAGDVFYVRETWGRKGRRFIYKADNELEEPDKGWKPSFLMPVEAIRTRLRITAVRHEPLQEMSDEDLDREGVDGDLEHFIEKWNGFYAGKGLGWDNNPPVWVIDFKLEPL